jgi:hypothetical protein
MDLQIVHGKYLGVLMILEKDGADELASFEGIASWDDQRLVVDRGKGNASFTIPDGATGLVQAVDENLRAVFQLADYYVPLLIRPLPENVDLRDYLAVGIRWPGFGSEETKSAE